MDNAGSSQPALGDAEFDRISTLVHQHLGIFLPPQKRSLVQQRLSRLVAEVGCRSYEEFVERYLQHNPSPELLGRIADRISTNHTWFWREPIHLEHFRDQILPGLRTSRAASRDVRIWCAAAATGEEPWTLAMLVTEALPDGWQGGVLATDISARALAIAEEGIYANDAASKMPEALRQRWMRQLPDGRWSVVPRLRGEVTYRRLNLIGQAFQFRKPFDAIFCRNVMIYFDEPTRRDVVRRIAEVSSSGAHLYIGLSETLDREDPYWKFVAPGIYRRRT